MRKLTAGDGPIDQTESRLQVLPPVSAIAPEAVQPAMPETSRKAKRRLKLEPLAPSGAVDAFSDQLFANSEVQVTTSNARTPLPVPSLSSPSSAESSAVVGVNELASMELTGDDQLSAISNWHTAVEEEPQSLMEQVSRFMSGWATSFVVHTVLLIVFALLTFGSPDRGKLMLSLANVDSETLDLETVEIEVNLDPIADASAADLEDDITQELSDDFAEESLDADELEQQLENFGITSLSGAGADSKLGRGGLEASAASGKVGVAGESIDFFGAYAKGKRFVFVIDCSGSMMGERWRRAKYELNRSINELGEDQQFCVVLYNSGTKVMMNARQLQLIKANDENKEKVSDWLNRQYPGGGTYPRRAMVLSLAENPDAVFLLSDGEIQDNTYEFLLANNKNKAGGQGEYGKIPVHTIALLSTFGQQMLKAIADDNEGTFTRVGRR